MASPSSPEPTDGSSEHPYITSLVKSMRAINKKISGMAKTDAVIKENPNVSLDDLVAQRKLNQDQKAQALKKPQLQAQLVTLEEQVQQYRKFDAENQAQIQKLKEELTFTHSQELEKIKQETQAQAVAQAEAELKKKLLIFSQFLQAAAAKRIAEEDPETDENKAFEGTLLLVYGGDQKAVDTALNLIEGSDEQVTSIEGTLLPVKFSQVKQAAVAHAPSTEEVDAPATVVNDYVPTGSDPTTANAGLTELQQPQTNGVPDTSEETESSTVQTEGNVAGERWDTAAGAEKEGIDEGYEVVPRPNEEVDTPAAAPAVASQPQVSSWADDSATGNLAGEAWDTKAPGQEVSAEIPTQTNGDDGFHEVAGKARGGRGGARGRGEGETRGGRGGRGGRGRGGPRGGRGDGEAPRGRGGRGRGPRGDGNAPARA